MSVNIGSNWTSMQRYSAISQTLIKAALTDGEHVLFRWESTDCTGTGWNSKMLLLLSCVTIQLHICLLAKLDSTASQTHTQLSSNNN